MDAKKYAAEAIGTFWLTFAGCGSAVIAAAFPQVGIGLVGVSLAFGLSVVTMAYAIGHVSGCHLNPAVTVGLAAGGRFPTGQIIPYVIAQVIGAVAASALLYVIASGAAGFDVAKGFASNGYGEHSPGHYGLVACLIMEVVMTMMFLFIIMGATHGKAPAGFAPLAIGLALVMIHLVSIPSPTRRSIPRAARVRRCSLVDGRLASSGCSGSHRCSAARLAASSIAGSVRNRLARSKVGIPERG
jgi:aquaporin Z